MSDGRFDDSSHFVHVIDTHYVSAACDASYLVSYIVWRVNLSKLSRKFVWALRTTTNCRVSFIDLYLAFPTNFRIVLLPHTNTDCNFTGTVLWCYHRAWVTCGFSSWSKTVSAQSKKAMMKKNEKPTATYALFII